MPHHATSHLPTNNIPLFTLKYNQTSPHTSPLQIIFTVVFSNLSPKSDPEEQWCFVNTPPSRDVFTSRSTHADSTARYSVKSTSKGQTGQLTARTPAREVLMFCFDVFCCLFRLKWWEAWENFLYSRANNPSPVCAMEANIWYPKVTVKCKSSLWKWIRSELLENLKLEPVDQSLRRLSSNTN